MLKLFKETDKIFNSNGDKTIDAKKAIVHKEDNKDFYLDLEVGIEHVKDIVERAIIVAPTPQGEQAFRITNVSKDRSIIKTRAYHVYYDSENLLIQGRYVVEKDCDTALKEFNAATSDQSPFTVSSDISKIATYHCIRHSLKEAIDIVLERWGGHLVRNNFNIEIRKDIGKDTGVTLNRTNLKEVSYDENWDDVVTKLLPVGRDGILLNSLDKNADVYVYSNIGYDIPYTKSVNFDQNDVEEDKFKYVDRISKEEKIDELRYKQALIADLKKQAQEYIIKNSVPKVNYQIKSDIQGVTDIGDIIKVYYKTLNIEILTNVIAYEYDCIRNKYIFLEFGNFRKDIKSVFYNLNFGVANILKENNKEIQMNFFEQLNTLSTNIKNNYQSGNVITNNNQLLLLDKLPKENAKNVIKFDDQGIGYSNTGLNGEFKNIISINGTLNVNNISNFKSAIKENQNKILNIGNRQNKDGTIKIYNNANELIAQMDNEGIIIVTKDGSQIIFDNIYGMRIINKDKQILHIEDDTISCANLKVENNFSIFGLKAKKITIRNEQGQIIRTGIGLY